MTETNCSSGSKKRNLQDIFLALKIYNLYKNTNVKSIYAKRIFGYLFRSCSTNTNLFHSSFPISISDFPEHNLYAK